MKEFHCVRKGIISSCMWMETSEKNSVFAVGLAKDPWKGNLKCKCEDLVLAVKFLFSRFLIGQSGNFIWLYLLYHPPKEVFKRKMRL